MSVLNHKEPPLLLLLVSEHPRGEYVHEMVLAVVSDQPTCPAAASHVTASSIHPYPVWSTHLPEVTTAYTIVCRPAIVLQELLEASQNSPVVAASQSIVPQAQLAPLAAVPSTVRQVGTGLQRPLLNVISQKSPVVAAAQSASPQAQSAPFASVPFVTKHTGIVLLEHRLPSE